MCAHICVCVGADHSLVHRLPVSDPGLLPGLPGGEGRRLHGRAQPRQPHRSAQPAGLRHLRRRTVVGAGTYTLHYVSLYRSATILYSFLGTKQTKNTSF